VVDVHSWCPTHDASTLSSLVPAAVDFEERYRMAFDGLHLTLVSGDACSPEELDAVERSLGISIPKSLRAYFRVAGHEARLNLAHNRLLPPSEWFVDSNRLAFLAENQNVVFWGVPLNAVQPDPPVLQGVNGDPIEWHPEHASCSDFLCVMLHWQAVMGGFERTWSAVVGSGFRKNLEGWTHVGETNGMHAFVRSGVALCFLQWDDDWRIFVAGANYADVERLSQSLSVSWDRAYV